MLYFSQEYSKKESKILVFFSTIPEFKNGTNAPICIFGSFSIAFLKNNVSVLDNISALAQ
jgi:hypothetical protein